MGNIVGVGYLEVPAAHCLELSLSCRCQFLISLDSSTNFCCSLGYQPALSKFCCNSNFKLQSKGMWESWVAYNKHNRAARAAS
ncbi:hypothetical protein Ancab_001786, partial [Ancistrocladus abbreviatus]